jgi:hypothetical protein
MEEATMTDQTDLEEIIDQLSSTDSNTISAALWRFGTLGVDPSGRIQSLLVNLISDVRPDVRNLAIQKAARWTKNSPIANALCSQLEQESDHRVLETILISSIKLIKEKHASHSLIEMKIAKLVVSSQLPISLRRVALYSLLFAYDVIDVREFAAPKNTPFKKLLMQNKEFLNRFL